MILDQIRPILDIIKLFGYKFEFGIEIGIWNRIEIVAKIDRTAKFEFENVDQSRFEFDLKPILTGSNRISLTNSDQKS